MGCVGVKRGDYMISSPVKRPILVYGACGGLLIVLLQVVQYRFLVIEHSLEIYGALVAAIFAGVGIWLGLRLTKTERVVVVQEVPVPATGPFTVNQDRLRDLGITPRELEILEQIARGLSMTTSNPPGRYLPRPRSACR